MFLLKYCTYKVLHRHTFFFFDEFFLNLLFISRFGAPSSLPRLSRKAVKNSVVKECPSAYLPPLSRPYNKWVKKTWAPWPRLPRLLPVNSRAAGFLGRNGGQRRCYASISSFFPNFIVVVWFSKVLPSRRVRASPTGVQANARGRRPLLLQIRPGLPGDI